MMSHQAALSQSHLRSLVRIFSTKALDYAPRMLLFNLDFVSSSVSMLQLSCPLQGILSYLRGSSQSHSRLSLFSRALCRHCLSAIAIRLVQPSIYLRSLILLSYATDPVNPSLSYGFSPLPSVVRVISVSQVILSISSCRCSSSLSSSTSTSRISIKPHRSSAPREGVLS